MAEPFPPTLADFLDTPAAGPPEDWVHASTRRGLTHDAIDELAQRAQDAELRAEESERRLADFDRTIDYWGSIDQSTALLAAVFNIDADRAFECLLWVSEQGGVSLSAMTGQLIARAGTLTADGRHRVDITRHLRELSQPRGHRAD